MKRIVTLTCLNAAGTVCTGAGCLSALNRRTGSFARYQGEAVELAAFLQCGGCQKDCLDPGLQEKLERIIGLKPDAVHVGVCTKKTDQSRCPVILSILENLSSNGIHWVDGTHS